MAKIPKRERSKHQKVMICEKSKFALILLVHIHLSTVFCSERVSLSVPRSLQLHR